MPLPPFRTSPQTNSNSGSQTNQSSGSQRKPEGSYEEFSSSEFEIAVPGQKNSLINKNSSQARESNFEYRPSLNIKSVIEPDENKINQILNFSGDVPTMKNGPIPFSEAQRNVCVYLSNGAFLFSKYNSLDSNIMQARQTLKKSKKSISTEYKVEPNVIKKLYLSAEKRSGIVRTGKYGIEIQEYQKEFFRIVEIGIRNKASDIHINVDSRNETVIRMRIDGAVQKIEERPKEWGDSLLQAAFNLADESDATYSALEYQGARVSGSKSPLPEGVETIRLQFNPSSGSGRYLIARLLYTAAAGATTDLDSLGYNQQHLNLLDIMRRKPYGLNVISGPTGSGKSTTLLVNMEAIARSKHFEDNIITIEDPPEFLINGAVQLPVMNANSAEERLEKFRQAISAGLRSDPDIIMIGELRDAASATLAYGAAMTGHPTWASLHANDALSILDRLRDLKVESYKLADYTLTTGLIGQRLVKKLCDNCKVPIKHGLKTNSVSELTYDECNQIFGNHIDEVYVSAKTNCSACGGKGYKGRTVIAEMIVPNSQFMDFVAKNDKAGAEKYWLEEMMGISMLEHGLQKIYSGFCNPDDIVGKAGSLLVVPKSRYEYLFSSEALK
jgi:general secretion pathway protein E